MALTDYRRKRSFDKTPEPTGGDSSGAMLRFVVQKHKASRLHYDFRLEMKGVLKSWAVPKGPSLDPSDKRLAMQVEDHPYGYKDFEGVIPKGNYGAGTVIVWDEGTYEPVERLKGKVAQERALLRQLKDGSLKIMLHGKKLKGEFALVRMKGNQDNAWLLIKHDDRYAKKVDITLKDKSVKTGKTLEKITASATDKRMNGRQVKKGRNAVKKTLEKQLSPTETDVPTKEADAATVLQKTNKSKFPTSLLPMFATLIAEPFDDPGWEYEVKWDGYRALAFVDGPKTKLLSRSGNRFNDRFYPVFDAVRSWDTRAVVDGEIVAVNGDGISSFNTLQNWRSETDGDLLFYVFDLLWYRGRDLTSVPLGERKAMLATLVPESSVIRGGYSVKARGTEFFDAAKALGLEGIIAKRSDSLYYPGSRSTDWLKIKIQRRQEVVIAGYTKNAGTSKPFSSLLLGVYDGGNLRYAGKVGTGFRHSEQLEMLAHFRPLVRKTSPFTGAVGYNKPSRFRPVPSDVHVTWLRPVLVCEIHFTEVTDDGVFRHPAFVAMREDKEAKDVVKELPTNKAAIGHKKSMTMTSTEGTHQSGSGRQKALLDPGRNKQSLKVGGIALELTNLDKVFWPAEGYTKHDMLEYYHQMARYILPYLKDRPQSLNRFPDGIDGQSFYQKDVTGKVPDWVEKYPYKAEGDKRKKHYMLCNNEASLLYMANLGAIEMNPWSSTVTNPDNPDWCILDLDPAKGNTFEQVIEVARTIWSLLEELKVPSCCKTSGSTGLHIYIPLGARYNYEQSQLFAKWVAAKVSDELAFTSIERSTDKRKGKVYIDYLQNRPAATLAAPYSLRPKPGATVSMPLHWDEVKSGLRMQDFTIENAFERVKTAGDLFRRVLKKGIDLKKILKKLG